MAEITLRIIDGADRGQIYEDLPTPVTIGREEGNSIQLNDERVSRFHVKIQEDRDKLVITDLESTNGSKVNGEDVQLRILRHGDIIHVGRSMLLVGNRDQIAVRLASLRNSDHTESEALQADLLADRLEAASLDFDLNWTEHADLQATMHVLEPPDLPEQLSPLQAAQLTEVLEYLHTRLRDLLTTVSTETSNSQVMLNARQWQKLLDVQARLAEYLHGIGEPDGPPHNLPDVDPDEP